MAQARIKPKQANLSVWYESVVEHAQLAQSSNIKGIFFILPHAWAIWEQIQNYLNGQFKLLNVRNVAFPSFVTLSDLAKEQAHIEGFAPELFQIHHDKPLNCALRPTSEILFCHYFANNLHTYKQLPLKLNQWANVFRVEKNTKVFLRTSEFFWHELHSIHIDHPDAIKFTHTIINVYQQMFRHFLCLPTLSGFKTLDERFAGALSTHTIETLMPDGQMLQSATVHDLADHFTKAFHIQFQAPNNQKQFAYQTSAGISTRVLGALIMVHGDDHGLVLPFHLAPVQIAFISLNIDLDAHHQPYQAIIETIHNYRYELDQSDKGLGYKLQQQQLLGTPITLVLGEKELNQQAILVIERVHLTKTLVPIQQLNTHLAQLIAKYDDTLYQVAETKLHQAILKCHTWNQVVAAIQQQKIALAPWFNDLTNEQNLKAQKSGFHIRCIAKEITTPNDAVKCVFSHQPANCWVYFARSY